jgi:predicted PurR-regulated permease PerM
MIPQAPSHAAGRIGLNVLLLLAGVVALHLARSVIVPMLIAVLLASVLGPAAAWLNATLKIRWSLACVAVVTAVVLANLVIFFVFTTSVTRLVNQISDEQKIINIYNKLRDNLENNSPWPLDQELFPKAPTAIDRIGVLKYLTDAGPWIFREVGTYSADWMWQLILILFTTFFVLLEGRMLARRVVAIFGPSPEVQTKATEVLFEMAEQVRTYLVWRTIINLGLAIVVGAFFQTVGLSQAWTWAILLAILNYVPYLGPVLASVPPFFDAFLSTSHPAMPFVIIAVYWVVIVLEGWLVVPLLMGRSMDLNATTVMLACMFWPLVWGPTGLFLAMPIMAAIKAILYHVPDWRPWANLMSSGEDELPEKDAVVPIDLPNGESSDPSFSAHPVPRER